MYREILEKFCKVFSLKMEVTDGVAEGSRSLISIYTVRLFKLHDSGKTMSTVMFAEGSSWSTSTESFSVEDACKKYIEMILLNEKKKARVYLSGKIGSSFPYDRVESIILSFPRSSLEALQMFLDMSDFNEED